MKEEGEGDVWYLTTRNCDLDTLRVLLPSTIHEMLTVRRHYHLKDEPEIYVNVNVVKEYTPESKKANNQIVKFIIQESVPQQQHTC